MMTSNNFAALPVLRQPPLTFGRLLLAYFLLAVIPYAWSLTQGLEYRGLYATIITALNIIGFTALLAQYPLSGRIDSVAQFTGIDNGMRLHRRAGEFTALFFFLHPFLILLPRFFIAPQKALGDTWKVFIAPESATGLFAWAIMGVWVLVAMNRKKIGMSYEAWRFSHGLGFVAVAILGTHHAVTVGRHGRYNAMFDLMWIVMCVVAVSVIAYTYFVRPFMLKRRPFKVVNSSKIGESDWELTIEKDGEFDFDFDAGQFLWINTSGNAFNRTEHPFSIASSPTTLPRISFVIRELGDYTSRLGQLRAGQKVYVDGPHGVFTLNGHKADGIGLIAGGAGIGPIMGILRQLNDLEERRPVRLVYGNRSFGQMVYQDEISAIADELPDFRQTLVLEQAEPGVTAEDGRISQDLLERQFDDAARKSWVFYVCGPPVMVEAVVKTLRKMDISEQQVLFEQLAF
jgi:predicted ferric reductase